jgi:hypothetical protein
MHPACLGIACKRGKQVLATGELFTGYPSYREAAYLYLTQVWKRNNPKNILTVKEKSAE